MTERVENATFADETVRLDGRAFVSRGQLRGASFHACVSARSNTPTSCAPDTP